jgi:hypothetical protein
MLRLRFRASLGLLVLLLAAVPSWAAGTAVQTVDARQLLAIARSGLTAAATAAGAAGPLAPGRVESRPFWSAIDGMGRSLDTVATTFTARSPAFFDALGAGNRALAELKAVWSHAGVDAPGVRSGLETLSAAYLLLRGSYGWEALRRQQGGALSADEERRFQAMQQAQAVLARRLANLRDQAARSGDRQAAADLSRLVAQARSAAQAASTLAAYLAGQVAAENLQGEWAADSRYVKPATRKAWKKAAPLVEDLTTGTDVGFVFTSDLSKVDGWAPLEAPVEVPAGTLLGSDLGTAVTALPLADAAPSPATSAGEEEGVPGAMVLGRDAGNGGDAEAVDPGDAPIPAPAVPTEEKGAPPAGEKKAEGKTEGKPEDGPAAAPAAIPAPAPAPPPPPASSASSPDVLH